jgi:hypothetical protein
MEKNTNAEVVVLGRVMYDRLVALAWIGACECGDTDVYRHVVKHAKKHNAALAEERRAAVLHAQQVDRERRAAVRTFIRSGVKDIFILSGTGLAVPATVLGRSRCKTRVDVRYKDSIRHVGQIRRDVDVENILTQLPSGWMEVLGGDLKGYFVPPVLNSALDDDVARAEEELKGLSRGTDSGT